MNPREITVHILGVILILTTLFFSDGSIPPWITVAPVLITSISLRLERKRAELVGLALFTLTSAYLIRDGSLDNIYLLLIFSFLYLIPLFTYWALVISDNLDFHVKGLLICTAYISSTLVLFYSLIWLSKIGEFILTAENYAPQALLLSASGLILFIPVHLLMSRFS